jgi:hypothetical protein
MKKRSARVAGPMPLAATPPTPRWPMHRVVGRPPQFWPQRRHIRPLAIERRTGPRELTRHTAARPTASPVRRRPAEPPAEDRGKKNPHHDLGHRHHDRRLLSPRCTNATPRCADCIPSSANPRADGGCVRRRRGLWVSALGSVPRMDRECQECESNSRWIGQTSIGWWPSGRPRPSWSWTVSSRAGTSL